MSGENDWWRVQQYSPSTMNASFELPLMERKNLNDKTPITAFISSEALCVSNCQNKKMSNNNNNNNNNFNTNSIDRLLGEFALKLANYMKSGT